MKNFDFYRTGEDEKHYQMKKSISIEDAISAL